jgi:hypothetical protein
LTQLASRRKRTARKNIFRIVKRLIFFLVLVFNTFPLFAEQQSDSVSLAQAIEIDEEPKEFRGVNDTLLITKKTFDSTKVQQLKSDPAFDYKQPPTVAESLWERFLSWLANFFDELFTGATTTGLGQILIYTGGVVLIIILVMMLLKVDAFKVFYSGADQGKQKYQVFHEDIHVMDFEKLIREASEKGDYRLGVRLIFLFALKKLSDKHLIDWQAGKTNHDYVEEINSKDLKTGLNELSFYFDYAWYGGFSIDSNLFARVEGVFNSWKDKVR